MRGLVFAAAATLSCMMAGPVAAQAPEAAARFIAELRANGCGMTEAEAEAILSRAGFTRTETSEIAGVLLEAGLAGLSDDWSTLTLGAELCEGDPANDAGIFAAALAALPPAPPPPEAPDPVELGGMLRDTLGLGFVQSMMEAFTDNNGCIIDLSDPVAARADIAATMTYALHMIYGLPDAPLEEPAASVLAELVEGFLADPGPFFDVEPDRLVLQGCTP
jgi:hypothetical protein